MRLRGEAARRRDPGSREGPVGQGQRASPLRPCRSVKRQRGREPATEVGCSTDRPGPSLPRAGGGTAATQRADVRRARARTDATNRAENRELPRGRLRDSGIHSRATRHAGVVGAEMQEVRVRGLAAGDVCERAAGGGSARANDGGRTRVGARGKCERLSGSKGSIYIKQDVLGPCGREYIRRD